MLSNIVEFLFCPAHGVLWQAGPCLGAMVVQGLAMVRALFSRRSRA
jgi:hypothetical protein